MGVLPEDLWVALGICTGFAVLAYLYSLAISAGMERELHDLRVEAHTLRLERQRRLSRANIQPGEVGVTIVDDEEADAQDAQAGEPSSASSEPGEPPTATVLDDEPREAAVAEPPIKQAA